MNLSQLPIRSRGQVVQVDGVDEISVRLMELLTRGSAIPRF